MRIASLHLRYVGMLAALILGASACDDDQADVAGDELAYLIDAESDEIVDALVITTPEETSEVTDDFEADAESDPTFSGDCFSLVYPIDVVYPDGGRTTALDGEELRVQVRSYLLADRGNLRRSRRPSFDYPVTVQTSDGTLAEINSRVDFVRQIVECRPEFEPCASVIFPVTADLGGSVESFETAEELRLGLRDYRVNNPERPRAELTWPRSFATAYGDTTSFGSRSEYRAFVSECRAARRGCFSFEFPVTVVHPLAGSRTVGTRPQLRRALSHAGPRGRWYIDFPVAVNVDGQALVLEDRRAFNDLRGACR